MKIQKKELNILLAILGLLAAVVVYFVYFTKQQENISSIQAEVNELQEHVAQLEKYDRDKETYKQRTLDTYDQIQAIIDQFPAEIREEDSIMYGRSLETGLDVNVSAITMATPVLLSEFGLGNRQKTLYGTVVNITYSGTYDNVKKMIEDIQTYEDKRNVSAFTAAYDTQTGNVAGTATLNLFALTGVDQIYQEPDTGNITHGVTNIFGGQ